MSSKNIVGWIYRIQLLRYNAFLHPIMMESAMAKKTTGRKTATSAASSAVPHMKLNFKLDQKKIEAIQNCLRKGKLTITVSNISKLGIRGTDPYIYD
jgi:hypothetical protein